MIACWVITTCPTQKEAKRIGSALLKSRSIACYDIVARSAAYFWPPETGKIETAKGAILLLTTLPVFVPVIYRTVRKLHSDTVPLLATLRLGSVPGDYYRWLQRELRQHKTARSSTTRRATG